MFKVFEANYSFHFLSFCKNLLLDDIDLLSVYLHFIPRVGFCQDFQLGLLVPSLPQQERQ